MDRQEIFRCFEVAMGSPSGQEEAVKKIVNDNNPWLLFYVGLDHWEVYGGERNLSTLFYLLRTMVNKENGDAWYIMEYVVETRPQICELLAEEIVACEHVDTADRGRLLRKILNNSIELKDADMGHRAVDALIELK